MKQFNIEKFMEYMRETFPEPMKYHFTYNLLKNIIIDLTEQCEDNSYLIFTICKIVPEITEKEILEFCTE